MKVLGEGPAARGDRAASAVLHDEPNVRVVAFHLQPGQRVAPHSSESTVLVQVIAGNGRFDGAASAHILKAGESAVYEPGETHAIEAGAEPLRFLAIITPRSGG